jgi:hypothetical protein
MKYVCLIYEPRDRDFPPEENKAILAEYQAFTRTVAQRGVMAGAQRLGDVPLATTVQVRDGKRLLSDGPFAEAKEVLAGFYILDCPGLDEALHYAAMIPTAKFGSIEVRPLVDL